jgi:AraC-like DNA-binding protein
VLTVRRNFFIFMADSKHSEQEQGALAVLPGLELPDRPELVQHVARYKHTGAAACRDEELSRDIIGRRLMDQGIKRIAKECGVSKWTVHAVLEAAEGEGILAPLKERVLKKAERLLEVGIERMAELAEDADNIKDLSVMWGIVSDKVAAGRGQPGLIVEHRGPSLNIEVFNLQFGPAENQSAGLVGVSPENGALARAGVGAGVGTVVDLVPVEAGSGAPAPGATDQAARVEGGGGGRVSAGVAAEDDGFNSGEKVAKATLPGAPTGGTTP